MTSIKAPWTDEQVLALLHWQTKSYAHPFTCGNEKHSEHIRLVPTNDGWVCGAQHCGYTQDWAHDFMFNIENHPKDPFEFLDESQETEIELPEKQHLMMEVLAGRYRTGEFRWTFESRFRKTAEKLQEKNLVGFKSGIVEDTILVWLTDKGKQLSLYKDYIPPYARNDGS